MALHCTVLHCTLLHCIVLNYTGHFTTLNPSVVDTQVSVNNAVMLMTHMALHCTALASLYYTKLHCIAQSCTALHYMTTLPVLPVHSPALHCSTLQRIYTVSCPSHCPGALCIIYSAVYIVYTTQYSFSVQCVVYST